LLLLYHIVGRNLTNEGLDKPVRGEVYLFLK